MPTRRIQNLKSSKKMAGKLSYLHIKPLKKKKKIVKKKVKKTEHAQWSMISYKDIMSIWWYQKKSLIKHNLSLQLVILSWY